MTSVLRASLIATVLLALGSAAAADPVGTWQTENGRSRIKIAACEGGGLCGTIVWLKDPNDPETGKPRTDRNNADSAKRGRPLIGVPIVLSMQPNGPNKWAGQVYNAEDGKTYSGNITELSPTSLKLEGCALGGLVCKGQTWTRQN